MADPAQQEGAAALDDPLWSPHDAHDAASLSRLLEPVVKRAFVAGAGLLAVFLLAGCPAGGSSSFSGRSAAREKGAAEVAAAVAAGKLELREYPPLPSPASHGEYIALLRERCGVAYKVPALPPGVAEADFIAEVRGWNETMEAEIRRKFGADILERLREEAGERWQAKIDAGKKR